MANEYYEIALRMIAALWAGFAPTSVGGDFSYAVVRGDSMRPHLDNGDIVVLRRERQYGIGDVIAYHDPRIGAVLHRIVGKEGEGFLVRGDNRDAPDPQAALPAEIVGRETAVWPHGLSVVLAVTSLRTLITGAVALVAMMLAWQGFRPRPPRFRRRRLPRRRGSEVRVA